jgi:hypothetical protein
MGTTGPGIATFVDAAFVFEQSARHSGILVGSDEFLGSGISYPPARGGRYRWFISRLPCLTSGSGGCSHVRSFWFALMGTSMELRAGLLPTFCRSPG